MTDHVVGYIPLLLLPPPLCLPLLLSLSLCLSLSLSLSLSLQISNVDDDSKSPIERPQSVVCEAGGQQCSASITLSVDGELSEGVKYIVNVMAVNRFGESEVSGNSEVFNIGEDSGNGGGSSLSVRECVCACIVDTLFMHTHTVHIYYCVAYTAYMYELCIAYL